MRPLGRVKIHWSPDFAYAIGLITTDGSLSKDGRHISFTSKDYELVDNFRKCLHCRANIGKKASGSLQGKKYFVVQIGDVLLYRFLQELGLTPNKSKIISSLIIPKKYFFDFLRGHFDGDGTFYSYWDKRWRSSFMFYTVFISASRKHVEWLREEIKKFLKLKGHITRNGSIYSLKYAKAESLKLLKKIYYKNNIVCLPRKLNKVKMALNIKKVEELAQVEKLVNSPA